MIGLARAGSVLFWKVEGPAHEKAAHGKAVTAPAWIIFLLLVLLTVFAGPATRFAEATADQRFARDAYIEAVLGYGIAGENSAGSDVR